MGTDKANLVFNGVTFLERLVGVFESANLPVVVVGRDHPASQATRSPMYVKDQRSDAGPLEGIRVGLEILAPTCEFALVISCDSPLLKIEVVQILLDRLGSAQAAVPFVGSEIYGTTAVYRTSLHPLIERELSLGNHSIKRLLEKLRVNFVEADALREVDPDLRSLININSPDDYQQMLNLG
jgi:molybdopterin-guanine dinucleotide biosynthesis protein A